MEEKELKIKIPKGYEIDKENSTFEVIKFKPITISYEDICKKTFSIPYYYINNYGITKNYTLNHGICCQDSSTTIKQLKKVLAINQLMNIAKYYNGDWEPDWNDSISIKYVINYNKVYNVYEVDFLQELNYGCVCFKSEEDAQSVIDNPNFRDILDTIFK